MPSLFCLPGWMVRDNRWVAGKGETACRSHLSYDLKGAHPNQCNYIRSVLVIME